MMVQNQHLKVLIIPVQAAGYFCFFCVDFVGLELLHLDLYLQILFAIVCMCICSCCFNSFYRI